MEFDGFVGLKRVPNRQSVRDDADVSLVGEGVPAEHGETARNAESFSTLYPVGLRTIEIDKRRYDQCIGSLAAKNAVDLRVGWDCGFYRRQSPVQSVPPCIARAQAQPRKDRLDETRQAFLASFAQRGRVVISGLEITKIIHACPKERKHGRPFVVAAGQRARDDRGVSCDELVGKAIVVVARALIEPQSDVMAAFGQRT